MVPTETELARREGRSSYEPAPNFMARIKAVHERYLYYREYENKIKCTFNPVGKYKSVSDDFEDYAEKVSKP
ncbi:MAG: hypothetical protein Q7V48_12240 [Deltaproteobacteria bacterium]|nr:hypothetical protein [Deltaproteobacteria bacterium]